MPSPRSEVGNKIYNLYLLQQNMVSKHSSHDYFEKWRKPHTSHMKSLSSPSTVPMYSFLLQGPLHFFKLLHTITCPHNWRQTTHAESIKDDKCHTIFLPDISPHFTIIISFFQILLVETPGVPGLPICFSMCLCLLITVSNRALTCMKAGLSVNNRHAKATKRCIYWRFCASQNLCQNHHTCPSSLTPATLEQENHFSFNSSAPLICGEVTYTFSIYLAKEKLI